MFSPLFMKDCTFSVEGTDYAGELSSVRIVPTSSQVNWHGLTPDSAFSESAAPTYACTVGYAQDWEEPTSWANFLYDQNGATKAVTFKPKAGGTVSWTVNVSVIPGDIGGDVGTFAEATVTLGCDMPVKTTTPAAEPEAVAKSTAATK